MKLMNVMNVIKVMNFTGAEEAAHSVRSGVEFRVKREISKESLTPGSWPFPKKWSEENPGYAERSIGPVTVFRQSNVLVFIL